MACEVYIPGDKSLFQKFVTEKNVIEEHLGSDIDWMELPTKKASRIRQTEPCDLNDDTMWPEYFAWLLSHAVSFRKAFGEVSI